MSTKSKRTIAALSAGIGAGSYGGYSFYSKYIDGIIKLKYPPPNSLLERKCNEELFDKPCWSDCYQIERKNVEIANEMKYEKICSDLIARSMFTSPGFRMEKYLFQKMGMWKHSEEDLLSSKFHILVNEKFGPFKVISKTDDQVLFGWVDNSIWSGVTFLSLSMNPSANDDCMDIRAQFGTGSIEPRQLPLFARLFTPIHSLYSRILLVSATDNLVKQLSGS